MHHPNQTRPICFMTNRCMLCLASTFSKVCDAFLLFLTVAVMAVIAEHSAQKFLQTSAVGQETLSGLVMF